MQFIHSTVTLQKVSSKGLLAQGPATQSSTCSCPTAAHQTSGTGCIPQHPPVSIPAGSEKLKIWWTNPLTDNKNIRCRK